MPSGVGVAVAQCSFVRVALRTEERVGKDRMRACVCYYRAATMKGGVECERARAGGTPVAADLEGGRKD